MIDLSFTQWIDVVQTAGLLGGGLWVAYTYWRFRKGQVSVVIEPTARLHTSATTAQPVLLIRLTIRNTSNTLFRYRTAAATLLDASGRTGDGSLQLVPLAEEDPFVPLYADITKEPESIAKGEIFEVAEKSGLSLEPGDFADAELAFPLTEDLGLMAMQVMIEGRQGRMGRKSYWWASFFYIDPLAELASPTDLRSSTLELKQS